MHINKSHTNIDRPKQSHTLWYKNLEVEITSLSFSVLYKCSLKGNSIDLASEDGMVMVWHIPIVPNLLDDLDFDVCQTNYWRSQFLDQDMVVMVLGCMNVGSPHMAAMIQHCMHHGAARVSCVRWVDRGHGNIAMNLFVVPWFIRTILFMIIKYSSIF